MTAKEKKEYMILGVLVLAIAIVLYLSFFRGSSEETPLPAPISVEGEALAPSTQVPFLPYGTTFDTKITEDQRLRVMIPPTYPTVDISEVGLPNPFVP